MTARYKDSAELDSMIPANGSAEPPWPVSSGSVDEPAEHVVITPPDLPATLQHPPDLAHERQILARFADELASAGVAGERRVVQLVYLVATSRLLPEPASLAAKGTSASGKSFLIKRVLDYFPAGAYYALTGGSEKAFIYSEESLVHRMLVIYEATGMAGDMQTYLIRTLLSEGRIRYETVVKTKEGVKGKLIDRPGPTGLITTTTAVSLHPENETRLLSLTMSDSAAQTAAVMLAHALGVERPARPVASWHELQTWLDDADHRVAVPFAVDLARSIPPVAVRLRRDFSMLITLIRAHAMLHQLTRERDADGAIVATIEDDYRVVRELIADLVGDAVGRTVSATVRATVQAVGDLTLAGGVTSVTALAHALDLDKSATSRRVRSAIERGYLRNLEDKRGQPSRIVVGDPLPDDVTVLPTVEVLQCCSASRGDSTPTEDPPVDLVAAARRIFGDDLIDSPMPS